MTPPDILHNTSGDTSQEISPEDYIPSGEISRKMEPKVEKIIRTLMDDIDTKEIKEIRHAIVETIFQDIQNIINIESIYKIKKAGPYLVLLSTGDNNIKKACIVDIRKISEFGYISIQEPGQIEMTQRKQIEEYNGKVERFGTIIDEIGIILKEHEGNFITARSSKSRPNTRAKLRKKLQGLRVEAKDLLREITVERVLLFEHKNPTDNDLVGYKEDYLHFLLGIGNENEQNVHIFQKSKGEVDVLIGDIIASKSPEELLEYMKTTHHIIDNNDYQDGTVVKNYEYFTDKFNEEAYAKIIKTISNKRKKTYGNIQLLVDFAKITSGREGMDSRYYDPELANTALFEAMKFQGGMIDQMKGRLEITDDALDGRSAKQVARECANIIEQTLTGMGHARDIDGAKILTDMKLGDFLGELGETPYKDLGFEDKIRVSSLVRLTEKLKPFDVYTTEEGTLPSQNGKEVAQWISGGGFGGGGPKTVFVEKNKMQRVNTTELLGLFGEAMQEASEHVGNELDRNFDSSTFEKLGDFFGFITPGYLNGKDYKGLMPGSTEAELFDLYNEINGNGNLWQVSDTTQGNLKTAGYMAAIVAGAIILGGATIGLLGVSGVIAQGAIYGGSASIMSWGVDAVMGDAQGYGSKGEMLTGVASDITTGVVTGMIGGMLVSRFGAQGKEFLLGGKVRNTSIFTIDLAALGVGTEALRLKKIDQKYHDSPIFTKEVD